MPVSSDRKAKVAYPADFPGVTAATADVVITENPLVTVDELPHLSEQLRKRHTASVLGGMALSLIGMGFAATGAPLLAQTAMFQEFIDVIAIGNALRLSFGKSLKTDTPPPDAKEHPDGPLAR